MSRIFVTGDFHGGIDYLKLDLRMHGVMQKQLRTLTKEDIVIILGDVGIVWDGAESDNRWQNWLNKQPYTTFGILGNHENYDLLKTYPIVDFHGGKAYKIKDSVYIGLNGEVFDFNGEKYFVMGGAESHDKIYRKEHISWWADEIPSKADFDKALDNFEKYNYKFDYILTHCGPSSIVDRFGYDERNDLTSFLNFVEREVEYNAWLMGHYHMDKSYNKFMIFYDGIAELVAED